MKNPIAERELVGALRTRRAFYMLAAVALVFAILVILRWPTDARVSEAGGESIKVFRLFGYGLLTLLGLLVPVFPAMSIINERQKGTMALLINSPLSRFSIYIGKLLGVAGFVGLLLLMSLPAALACFGMGGLSLTRDIGLLYAVLGIACLQFITLGLYISSLAGSNDSALRLTYGFVLVLIVGVLAPYLFFQGDTVPTLNDILFANGPSRAFTALLAGLGRVVGPHIMNLSPVPAVMEILGQGNLLSRGVSLQSGAPLRYLLWAGGSALLFALLTLRRLDFSMFDRSRSQGVITDDQSVAVRRRRRVMFLVDPQKRKAGIGPFVNPVMVKEFRCRQFGRFHWLLRLIAFCALISLLLCYLTTTGTMDWEVETIGAIIVVLQVTLIVLFTPSLAGGLISSERESGGWDLLRATPMSASKIVRGKLMSVIFTLVLLLFATIPGYLVIIWIKPILRSQVEQVLVCLGLTAVFAVVLSATVSSFFRRTAPATATSYAILLAICAGTMLIWMGRGAPFGDTAVQQALSVNPMAAALSVIEARGFREYSLVPLNWWIMSIASAALFLVLIVRTWQLTRPQ